METITQDKINPSAIIELSHGYWLSQVLYVAVKLNVFTLLKDKKLTTSNISHAINTPEESTEKLLNACCALNLLQKDNDRYYNLPLADNFLVEGKDSYLGYFISLMGELYKNWGGLLQSVKENKPANDRFGGDNGPSDESARFFTLAMHSNSSLTAPLLASAVDLSENKKLLDLGGGSGINAIVLAEKNPNLSAVIYDFPSVIKIAETFISESRARDRLKTQTGNYNKDNLPKGFDCILLSHILHAEGSTGSKTLLKRCYDVLERGGKIIIADFILNENKTGPLFPALFALNMLVETRHGNAFTGEEISLFLKESGFNLEGIKHVGDSPITLIIGRKS